MEKTARRPSTDPVQEKLRQNKVNWNKEVSEFINNLIHLKKTMNGWPSKFHKERSRIVEPIPSDPATIIGALAGDFQEIATKGNSIVQEQLNYSKTRRKRQPKQLGLPFPPAAPKPPAAPAAPATPGAKPSPDLSGQLELGLASDNNYYLVSEASNPLTRFFARLLSPGLGGSEGARVRRYRASLLNASAQMYKDLKKMQSAILGSGPQSIFLASKLLDKTENNWVFLASGFKTYVDTLPEGAKDTGAKIKPPSKKEDEEAPPVEAPPSKAPEAAPPSAVSTALTDPRVVAALAAVQDVQNYADNFKGVIGMPGLRQMAKKFSVAPSHEKIQNAESFLDEYRRMVIQISANKQIPVQSSLANIVAFQLKATQTPPPATASAQDQIQVVAQMFLKKLRHQFSPFDKTSSFRLDVYNMAEENRKLLDDVMDHLEEGLDKDKLSELLEKVAANMRKIKALMEGLKSTIRGLGYQPEFLNLLERGRLGDHGIELDPKQRLQLSKMLEQKQMRELSKMYG